MGRTAVACLALLCAASGCEDHRAAANGSGPIQLVARTDIDLAHWAHEWLGDRIVYAAAAQPAGFDLWSRRLDEPRPELLASGVNLWDAFPSDGPSPGWVATISEDADDTVTYTLHPLNETATIVIDRVRTNSVHCVASSCAMMRGDPGGPAVMWHGRWDALRPVPAGLSVMHFQPDVPGHWLVLAAADGASGNGIYDIGDDGSLSELVPARLDNAEVLPGFEEAGPLESASVAAVLQRVSDGSCRLLYDRSMADGTRRSFALRRETGRELVLPAPPSVVPATVRSGVIWTEELEASTKDFTRRVRYRLWDLLTDRIESCDVGKVTTDFTDSTPDGEILIHGGAQTTSQGVTVRRRGEPCVSIEQPAWYAESDSSGYDDWHTPLVAPDHASIVWLSHLGTGGTELWTADGHGDNARQLPGVGDVSDVRFLDRSDELLVKHVLPDGDAWALVELGSGPPALRPLAEGVFRDLSRRAFVQVGPRSLLMGTGWNAQDGTGDLSIVDLDTASRNVLDTSVKGFRAEAAGVVLYQVHGRYPSARDGIWARRLP